MTPLVYVKQYAEPARGVAARAHWRWLAGLDSGVRLPHLHPGTGRHLVSEHLPGVQPRPGDLAALADTLGRLHAAAYRRELHTARLDQPYRTATGLVIGDFYTTRPAVLASLPDGYAADWPAAIYKDANIRNFVITCAGPAIVDFDDLTLAPFGYDLAKLVVSIAMTYGRIPAETITGALQIYNAHTTNAAGPPARCPPNRLRLFAELHHALTARYLYRHGYRHPWTAVRPWPVPVPPRDPSRSTRDRHR